MHNELICKGMNADDMLLDLSPKRPSLWHFIEVESSGLADMERYGIEQQPHGVKLAILTSTITIL